MLSDNPKIGQKTENKGLEPKPVKILDVSVKPSVGLGKNGKELSPLIQLHCQHPDSPQPVFINKAKLLKGEKLEVQWLNFRKDADGNLQKNSTIAILLEHCKVQTINDLVGKTLETTTVSKETPYLCIKCYT